MAFSIAGGGTLNALGYRRALATAAHRDVCGWEAFEQKFTGKTNASLVLGSPYATFLPTNQPVVFVESSK